MPTSPTSPTAWMERNGKVDLEKNQPLRRWMILNKQYKKGRYPFMPRNVDTMTALLNRFRNKDGEIDRKKLARLETAQRVYFMRRKKSKFSARLKDELFLLGAYIFDLFSPDPDDIGKFVIVLAPLVVMSILCIHSYMSGQLTTFEAELRFRECEAEQAIVYAARVETQSLLTRTALSASLTLELAGDAEQTAALNANATRDLVQQELDSSMANLLASEAAYTAQSATEGVQQNVIGDQVYDGVHSAGRAQGRLAGLRGPEGEITDERCAAGQLDAAFCAELEQAVRDANAYNANVDGLFADNDALDVSMQAGRDALDQATERAQRLQEQQGIRAQAAQEDAELQAQKAQTVALAAADDIALTEADQAAANDVLDPWAALGALTAVSSGSALADDAVSVALLEAKLANTASGGFGAAERTCTQLFVPARASPGLMERSLDGFRRNFPDEFLVRWGARYSPNILDEDQGYRFFSSIFVHGSWAQLLSTALTIGVLGSVLERRYGSVRFVSIFLLSGLGGGFLGAIADGGCSVVTGADGAAFGLIGFYLCDSAVSYLSKMAKPMALPMAFDTVLAVIVCIVQIVSAFTGGPLGHLTNFGGFITGFVVSTVSMPSFISETLESALPAVSSLVCIFLFAVLPGVFYAQDVPFCPEEDWVL